MVGSDSDKTLFDFFFFFFLKKTILYTVFCLFCQSVGMVMEYRYNEIGKTSVDTDGHGVFVLVLLRPVQTLATDQGFCLQTGLARPHVFRHRHGGLVAKASAS